MASFFRLSVVGVLLVVAAGVTAADQAVQVLFDFGTGADLSGITTTDARMAVVPTGAASVLRVMTGHQQPWPGVTLRAPAGRWDLSAFGRIEVSVANTGPLPVTLYCRVDNAGADGTNHCVTDSLAVAPGQSGLLAVVVQRTTGSTLDGRLFGMRGYPATAGGPGTVDASAITQLLIFVNKPTEDYRFEVATVRAAGSYTPPTAWVTDAAPFLPFIDAFGQYRHKDWPGKVHSAAELQQQRTLEAADLAAAPGPANWDRYGGWKTGPQLAATGFFRTEKVDGRWWLVDPDGHLFFSNGVDCVGMIDTTPVDERESWFEDFPGSRPEGAEFLSTGYSLKGHYAGRSPRCFAFAALNAQRKYGKAWRQAYAETIHQRLRSWGLNTIANWSDSSVYLLRRTPYTDTLSSSGAVRIQGSEGYWGQFVDVFDPSFGATVRAALEAKKATSANDPWCIGYFSDNEMSWGDDTSLAIAALQSPAGQAAKGELVADLRAKYGDITHLNTAWGASYGSWRDLLDGRAAPDKLKARTDLVAFYARTAQTYFRTIRDAIKAATPNQLYLGCRFAWVNDAAAQAAASYCDVVSYNLYRRSVADFRYPGPDKPLIIGEFHFGALDRGMFHTGLVPVENQAARAQAYKDYVLGALRHPQWVGTHWFQWQDEPTTGRAYDEENYQIGLVDVADTPYTETIGAIAEVGRTMYEVRSGS
jgi:hypothetical protein